MQPLDRRQFLALTAAGLAATRLRAQEPAKPTVMLQDGDRIVFLGNTLIEREQQSGYWETEITRRHPKLNLTFRNLGWSGDTVFGVARAGFGSVADGFKNLKEQVFAAQPTVLVVGYGMGESFEGEAFLPKFRDGLKVLLDTLAPTKARLVILSPQYHENLGKPLPDPAEHNKVLRAYRDALAEVAKERGAPFVDLYSLMEITGIPDLARTDNGIHLSAQGYWDTAWLVAQGLGSPAAAPHIVIEGPAQATGEGMTLRQVEGKPWQFTVEEASLPAPAAPTVANASGPQMKVAGLPDGRHALRINDQEVASYPSQAWAQGGITLPRHPNEGATEALRQAIVAKNRLFFHRWRPQNETYLYGFRKHEQGQNAREIAQFDPLIAKAEEEIAKRRQPKPYRIQLVPAEK